MDLTLLPDSFFADALSLIEQLVEVWANESMERLRRPASSGLDTLELDLAAAEGCSVQAYGDC